MCLFRDMNNGTQHIKLSYSAFCAVAIYQHFKEGVEYSFTPKILYNSMLNKPLNTYVNNSEIKGIKLGLEELETKHWIKYKKQGTTYTITESNLFNDKDGTFFVIPLEYINRILKQKCNKITLLHHYLYLVSTINIKQKVGFTSREAIANVLNVSSLKTITLRNKKLEELGVIKFITRKGKDINNHFINMTNIYGLPEDIKLLEKYKEKSIKDETKRINQEITKFNNLYDDNNDENPF